MGDMAVREIGGYLELEKNRAPMLHEGAISLNCGRNSLRYLLKARKIKKIVLPYFLCDSVKDVCEHHIEVRYYHVGFDFKPIDLQLKEDEWLYLVNYYGQLTDDEIWYYVDTFARVVVDYAHAYFRKPLEGVDTIYTCRKFFGVPDGSFLYTDLKEFEEYPLDESFERLLFLAGRFERNASEFYGRYNENESIFEKTPIRKMSRLTENLLRGIDYSYVKNQRTKNYSFLYRQLKQINELTIREIEGAYMYPLLLKNGAEVRCKLIENKVYIPVLWPNVLIEVPKESLEYVMANNILPIPCDQRYDISDMERICKLIVDSV